MGETVLLEWLGGHSFVERADDDVELGAIVYEHRINGEVHCHKGATKDTQAAFREAGRDLREDMLLACCEKAPEHPAFSGERQNFRQWAEDAHATGQEL